ncbi:DUF192 domain-containing protein [Candidatus Daviesbacteria bacterium]|nr:DUF192 domain-containing protein [Candidatus Daviesbacteria bacterium]
MKKFIIQIVILLIFIFVAIGFWTNRITTIPFVPEKVDTKNVEINGKLLRVEIADTLTKRTKGLGGRESLASGSGMLFMFPEEKQYSFWMKGLKFPIDIIWIKDQKVADIIKNVPPPQEGQEDNELPIYQPNQPVDMVLEVNVGTVDMLGIQIGDTIVVK